MGMIYEFKYNQEKQQQQNKNKYKCLNFGIGGIINEM